jgi:hypothetical protein
MVTCIRVGTQAVGTVCRRQLSGKANGRAPVTGPHTVGALEALHTSQPNVLMARRSAQMTASKPPPARCGVFLFQMFGAF